MWRPGVFVAFAVLLASSSAGADKLDETLDLSLHGRSAWFEADQRALSAAPEQTAPRLEAAGPRLAGTGRSFGGMARGNLSIDGLRFGLGLGFASVTDLRVDASLDLEAGRLFAVPLEAFVGYAFGSARDLRPFVEARGSLTILRLGLADGDLGAAFNAYAPGLALRTGVLVPLSLYFLFEVGGGAGIVGPERFTLDAGLGLPIPLANL
ncbi:MAG: hypothetical protein R3B72_06610 [Polyangiaceae bacterium]